MDGHIIDEHVLVKQHQTHIWIASPRARDIGPFLIAGKRDEYRIPKFQTQKMTVVYAV